MLGKYFEHFFVFDSYLRDCVFVYFLKDFRLSMCPGYVMLVILAY